MHYGFFANNSLQLAIFLLQLFYNLNPMKISRSDYFPFAIIISSFAIAALAYPRLPEQVASHWNAAGQADEYMGRFWGAFFLPFMLVGMYALFKIIPIIDPKAENIAKFKKYFDWFINSMFVFFFYLFALTLFWNFGYNFNMGRFIIPGFSILFFQVGILLSHAEPNWSIGIRTPWTLSSDTVWRKVHSLGAKLFRAVSIFMLIGVIFPGTGLWIALVFILGTSIFLVAYSYFLYRREKTPSK
jgi:uncharacterized membrane protein